MQLEDAQVLRLSEVPNMGHTTYVLAECLSTNATLLSMVAKNSPSEGTAILAHYQTQGRGQIGRKWHSKAGLNLLTSLLLRPNSLAISDQYLLNVYLSIAISDYIIAQGIDEISIKWPNDIYIGHSKVCGLLIQCSLKGKTIQSAVVGIGLNLNQTLWPSYLPNPISLSSATSLSYDITAEAMRVYACLDKRYQQLLDGDHDSLLRTYHDRLYGRDTVATYYIEGQAAEGRIKGIDNEGRLLIDWVDAAASIQAYRHGEIEYSIN